MWACSYGHYEVIQYLLDQKACVDAVAKVRLLHIS